MHVPGLHLACSSHVPGLHLALGGFEVSAFRFHPLSLHHKPHEYNSPPAPPSGWSGRTLDMPWYHRTPSNPPFSISRTYSARSIRRCVGCVLPAPTVSCRRLPGDTPASTRGGSRNAIYFQGFHSTFCIQRALCCLRSQVGCSALPQFTNARLAWALPARFRGTAIAQPALLPNCTGCSTTQRMRGGHPQSASKCGKRIGYGLLATLSQGCLRESPPT